MPLPISHVKGQMTKEMKDLLEVVGASTYPIQALKNFFYMFTQFYAVMVGSLLAVFVPQLCCKNVPNPYNICVTGAASEVPYLCELSDNFTGLTRYNTFVLGWNFITLVGICI
jgi:hypothetical protein